MAELSKTVFDLDAVISSSIPHPTEDINELTSAALYRILTAVDVSFQGKAECCRHITSTNDHIQCMPKATLSM